MKNCLILGFGRSGTSLMGGILHSSGYYMGDKLYPPRHSNPKGFFENKEINAINERILESYDKAKTCPECHNYPQNYSPYKPRKGQRWLTYINPEEIIICDDRYILSDISKETIKPNFAYKDPRFNYTLGVWRPFLPNAIFICVFRDPAVTIRSVLDECASVDYLKDFYIDKKIASEIWVNSYKHVFKNMQRPHDEQFVFVHYNQILNGSKLGFISEMLNTVLNHDFADHKLNRSGEVLHICPEAKIIYNKMCQMADYKNLSR